MALSGSFSGSILGGNYKLRVDWSATQNVAANTSKITAAMYLVQASSWSIGISSRDDNTTTINGVASTWTSPAINNGGGKTTKLGTVTSGDISHNADGSKSVTITAVFNIKATISGTYYSSIRASATVTLNDIPRATQPTLSASSVNMGSAVTISMPRASSGFTHDLAYSFNGGSYASIATGQGASYSWTVPDLASKIPNATSGNMTVRCITKNGSKTIGTKTVKLVAKVPSSVVPTVGTVTVAEATSGLAAQFGAYIQGKSTLKTTISASGAKGSTITAYSTTLEGRTYTGSSWTSAVLTGKGSIKLVTKVKDSRGRWSTSKTTTVTVLAYSAPQIQALQAYRVDASGAADETGEYIAVAYRYSVTALGNKNTASMLIEYKKTSETTWSGLQTGTALSANTTTKPSDLVVSTDYQYDVRLTVTDWFGASRTYTTTLPSGAVILDLLANGKGISFGGVAQQDGIDLRWPVVGRTVSMGSLAGQHRLESGQLLQWGTVSITPSAANTPTTGTLTYPQAFKQLPIMLLSIVSSVPEKCSAGVKDRTTTSCSIVLTRTDTTSTIINWLAIGPG